MITLELWMIALLAIVFIYALYDLYVTGYVKGFMEGGVHAHLFTMQFVKEAVTPDQLKQIRESIQKLKQDSQT
jgi:hypothetical protein